MKKMRFLNALALMVILTTPLKSNDLGNLQDALTALKSKLGQLGTALHELANPPVVQPLTAAEISKLEKIKTALIARITADATMHESEDATTIIIKAQQDLQKKIEEGQKKLDNFMQTDEKRILELKENKARLDTEAMEKRKEIAIKTTTLQRKQEELAKKNLADSKISQLKLDSTTLKQEIDTLKQGIDTLNQKYGPIQTELEKLRTKKSEIQTSATIDPTLLRNYAPFFSLQNLNFETLQGLEKAITETKNALQQGSPYPTSDFFKAVSPSNLATNPQEFQDTIDSVLKGINQTITSLKASTVQTITQNLAYLVMLYLERDGLNSSTLDSFTQLPGKAQGLDQGEIAPEIWQNLITTDSENQAIIAKSLVFQNQINKDESILQKKIKALISTANKGTPDNPTPQEIQDFYKRTLTHFHKQTAQNYKQFYAALEPIYAAGFLYIFAKEKNKFERILKDQISDTLNKVRQFFFNDPSNFYFQRSEFECKKPDKSFFNTPSSPSSEPKVSRGSIMDPARLSILLNKIKSKQATPTDINAYLISFPENKSVGMENLGVSGITDAQQLKSLRTQLERIQKEIPDLEEQIIEIQKDIVQETNPKKLQKLNTELKDLTDDLNVLTEPKLPLAKLIEKIDAQSKLIAQLKPTQRPKPTEQQMIDSKADIDAMAEWIAHENIQNPEELHHFFNNPTEVEATYQLSDIVTIPELLKYLQDELSKLVHGKGKFSQEKLAAIFAEAPAEIKTHIEKLASVTPQKPPLPDRPGQPTPAPTPAPIKILSYDQLITAGKKIFDDLSKLEIPGDALISRMQHEAKKTPHKALETFIFQKYNDNAVWFDQIVEGNKPEHEEIIKVIQEVKHALESTSAPSTPAAQNQKPDLPAQPGPSKRSNSQNRPEPNLKRPKKNLRGLKKFIIKN
ncbi:hypothetical protein IPF37_00840 [bacterium]|nr:MAG: hypothetical protein IPF37_00840 [bacterium]